jgi:hypothetical protein
MKGEGDTMDSARSRRLPGPGPGPAGGGAVIATGQGKAEQCAAMRKPSDARALASVCVTVLRA